jgi:hypothetical protein
MQLYDPNENLISSIVFDKDHPLIVRRFLPGASLLPRELLSETVRLAFASLRLLCLVGLAYSFLHRQRAALLFYWAALSLDLLGRGVGEETAARVRWLAQLGDGLNLALLHLAALLSLSSRSQDPALFFLVLLPGLLEVAVRSLPASLDGQERPQPSFYDLLRGHSPLLVSTVTLLSEVFLLLLWQWCVRQANPN